MFGVYQVSIVFVWDSAFEIIQNIQTPFCL